MATTILSSNADATFAPMSAPRLFIFAGIALIVAGMIFGDIFAVFLLHQNAGHTGETLLAAAQAAAEGDSGGVRDAFARMGRLLEDHGTKVDTHVHMTDAGYLGLLLALVQPYVALPSRSKKLLARIFIVGGVMLSVGIFLIYSIGLAYSPFPTIGWASVVADTGGLMLIVALIGEAWGLCRYLRGERRDTAESVPPEENSWCRRALLSGGTFLTLLGFVYGAWYAAFDLYPQEQNEITILKELLHPGSAQLSALVNDYGSSVGQKAVQIAAHSHLIEFGLLALLLSFVQPYVFLGEVWKRTWVVVLLAGSLILPVCVFLEMKFGLLAGAAADFGGLMVIVALISMLVGVLRYTGGIDLSGALR